MFQVNTYIRYSDFQSKSELLITENSAPPSLLTFGITLASSGKFQTCMHQRRTDCGRKVTLTAMECYYEMMIPTQGEKGRDNRTAQQRQTNTNYKPSFDHARQFIRSIKQISAIHTGDKPYYSYIMLTFPCSQDPLTPTFV